MYKKNCSVCDKFVRPRKHINGKPLCSKCYKEPCALCKEVAKPAKIKNGVAFCKKCYKEKCRVCGSYSLPFGNNENGFICRKCYSPPEKICFICKNMGPINKILDDGNGICVRCYEQKSRPVEICSICKNMEIVSTRKNGYIVCKKCYERKMEACTLCNQIYYVKQRNKNGDPICTKCSGKNYDRKIENCTSCNKVDYVWLRNKNEKLCRKCYGSRKDCCYVCEKTKCVKSYYEGSPICERCYKKLFLWRRNPQAQIIESLRERVRSAFKQYSKNGKIYSSSKYGIDYKKIIEYLGPCPGNREDYHIDHKFPLAAFDFNNPIHIKAAFAPENHQWLRAEENLKKSNQYNIEKFKNYIKKYEEGEVL